MTLLDSHTRSIHAICPESIQVNHKTTSPFRWPRSCLLTWTWFKAASFCKKAGTERSIWVPDFFITHLNFYTITSFLLRYFRLISVVRCFTYDLFMTTLWTDLRSWMSSARTSNAVGYLSWPTFFCWSNRALFHSVLICVFLDSGFEWMLLDFGEEWMKKKRRRSLVRCLVVIWAIILQPILDFVRTHGRWIGLMRPTIKPRRIPKMPKGPTRSPVQMVPREVGGDVITFLAVPQVSIVFGWDHWANMCVMCSKIFVPTAKNANDICSSWGCPPPPFVLSQRISSIFCRASLSYVRLSSSSCKKSFLQEIGDACIGFPQKKNCCKKVAYINVLTKNSAPPVIRLYKLTLGVLFCARYAQHSRSQSFFGLLVILIFVAPIVVRDMGGVYRGYH